jgi:hypothetical protein
VHETTLQELQEETSISSVQLLAEAQGWLQYDFPPEVRARLSSYWARYKGQAQRWFLFKFTGEDSGELHIIGGVAVFTVLQTHSAWV